ncbi:MAG: class I SAM-dependent methyltransferase [Slackia sp.]
MTLPESTNAVNDTLASWNDRAHVHANGGYGDLDALASNSSHITGVAQRDFAVLAPHLPDNRSRACAFCICNAISAPTPFAGIVWAPRKSGVSIFLHIARIRTQARGKANVAVTFVQADVRKAAEALADQCGTFDAIVTSAGTITWLPELTAWAKSIESLLAPGGVFAIRDDHPMLFALDNSGLSVVQDCFGGTEVVYEEDSSYVTDPSCEGNGGKLTHTVNHNWAHDFQEIIGALLQAGLVLESLHEHDVADWRSLPMLEFDEDDEGWRMPDGLPRIPLTFSIIARKPR